MASFFRNSNLGNKLKFAGSKAKHWMKHHPIAANSALCLNLWVAGDVLAQYSEDKILHDVVDKNVEHELEIDWMRTAKCASYGATVTGPILAFWYPFLEKMSKQYRWTARFGLWGAPVLKVLADEIILDPPFLVMFFSYMNMCEGGDRDSLVHKLKSEFWNSYLMSWMTWPVILLGTFRYLPIYAQAPLINVCCIVWDGFLSHRNAVARLEQAKAENEKKEEERKIEVSGLGNALEFVQEKKGDFETIGSALKDGSGSEIFAASPDRHPR